MKSLFLVAFIMFASFGQAELPLIQLMKERHSGRGYDAAKPMQSHQLYLLAQAAQATSSSYNEQPWHFVFCNRQLTPEAFKKALGCLQESNQAWAKNAQTIILTIAKINGKNGKPNAFALYDTGAAAFSMALMAADLGLMAHQAGGFYPEKVRKEFSIPAEYTPVSLMIVGYELQSSEFPNRPRERKAIAENFYLGKWGNGLQN